MKEHITKFLDDTYDARHLSEKCRDYKDNKQWTDDERETLEARGQAAITINRIKNKVQGMIGLYISRRTDPKAYARTPKHEKASYAISDALRYVKDKTKFDHKKLEVCDNLLVEGYGGVFIGVDEKGDPTVEVIPWDRIYFDTHSRRKDFKDCRYKGIIIWMEEETFVERWGRKKFEQCYTQDFQEEIFEDRPRYSQSDYFVDKNKGRVRVAQEYYIKKGVWHEKFFCGDIVLEDQESPYYDEEGTPICPIELLCAYIDRDNRRFGEVRYFLDLQDEINHRRSKFLHLLSNRQTVSRQGAIENIAKMKRELKRPDGHIEYKGEKGDFDLLGTNDMADGQFMLMQTSMQEMDATTFNAELAGQRQGDLSGRSVEKLQAAGMLTTEEIFFLLKGWEERVYTQIWFRILESWQEEKWVRVTDDYNNLRYVGFNVQITLGERLQEVASDESIPLMQRQQAQLVLQQLSQAQDQRLSQPVDVSNPIPELEMDIIIEHAPDTINIQQEQFQMLVELAQARPEIPLEEVIELSQIRNKDQLVQRLRQQREQMMAMQQQAQQSEDQRKNMQTQADAMKKMQEAEGKAIDNRTEQMKQIVLATNPPDQITANV